MILREPPEIAPFFYLWGICAGMWLLIVQGIRWLLNEVEEWD